MEKGVGKDLQDVEYSLIRYICNKELCFRINEEISTMEIELCDF